MKSILHVIAYINKLVGVHAPREKPAYHHLENSKDSGVLQHGSERKKPVSTNITVP
ncbi:hypothetical protein F511_46120 [Dorcoceras hygrometricum]|uniref:Uncharacterized protein n=1 Tax=Dorcoceras hygrometricum TaxID=472368 RepID=A0A2Z6ZUC6_9LAMI|nr:hypothetical protein F511_46120 [Dorcoceras hygrometricum]